MSDNMECLLKEARPHTSSEDKENIMDRSNSLDTTIVHNPEDKPVRPRDSILKLFDPLYSAKRSPVQEHIKQPEFKQKNLEDLYSNPEEFAIKTVKTLLDEDNLIEYSSFRDSLPQVIKEIQEKMASSLETSIKCEEEMTALKLELNQLQQEKSTLELELHQKDEVILKGQGESQKRENSLKQDIKTLTEKLSQTSEIENSEELQLLKSENIALKKSEEDLLRQINELCSNEQKFKALMAEYESTFSQKVDASQKLKDEHDTAKRHLATLEMSFSDLHTKYERSKDIIAGYKDNEETLILNLKAAHEGAIANEGRYNMLKAHAKSQLDKSNKEILLLKKESHMECSKLTTIIRRLEIKVESIQQALDQKNIECTALAALCDEVTGSIPQ